MILKRFFIIGKISFSEKILSDISDSVFPSLTNTYLFAELVNKVKKKK